jgi:hypothetical protein
LPLQLLRAEGRQQPTVPVRHSGLDGAGHGLRQHIPPSGPFRRADCTDNARPGRVCAAPHTRHVARGASAARVTFASQTSSGPCCTIASLEPASTAALSCSSCCTMVRVALARCSELTLASTCKRAAQRASLSLGALRAPPVAQSPSCASASASASASAPPACPVGALHLAAGPAPSRSAAACAPAAPGCTAPAACPAAARPAETGRPAGPGWRLRRLEGAAAEGRSWQVHSAAQAGLPQTARQAGMAQDAPGERLRLASCSTWRTQQRLTCCPWEQGAGHQAQLRQRVRAALAAAGQHQRVAQQVLLEPQRREAGARVDELRHLRTREAQ